MQAVMPAREVSNLKDRLRATRKRRVKERNANSRPAHSFAPWVMQPSCAASGSLPEFQTPPGITLSVAVSFVKKRVDELRPFQWPPLFACTKTVVKQFRLPTISSAFRGSILRLTHDSDWISAMFIAVNMA